MMSLQFRYIINKIKIIRYCLLSIIFIQISRSNFYFKNIERTYINYNTFTYLNLLFICIDYYIFLEWCIV